MKIKLCILLIFCLINLVGCSSPKRPLTISKVPLPKFEKTTLTIY